MRRIKPMYFFVCESWIHSKDNMSRGVLRIKIYLVVQLLSITLCSDKWIPLLSWMFDPLDSKNLKLLTRLFKCSTGLALAEHASSILPATNTYHLCNFPFQEIVLKV